jgi:hypothetical protein
MSSMTKHPKRPRDPNQLAKSVVELATGDNVEEDTTAPSNRRHVGGEKGGLARAKTLTATQRREIAKKAAIVRWAKKP